MEFFNRLFRNREEDNPLPRMTHLEQATQFQVEVIGPLGKTTIASIMRNRGFQKRGGKWVYELPDGD
jgi:hypothetical protein